MKQLLLFTLICLPFFPALAQQKTTEPLEKVYTFVEKIPEFPGGQDSLSAYLSRTIRYPKEALENGTEGLVVASFVVNKQGGISDIKILKGLGFGTEEESIRAISGMPKWIPGRQNMKDVNVQYTLPVRFIITQEMKTKTKVKHKN